MDPTPTFTMDDASMDSSGFPDLTGMPSAVGGFFTLVVLLMVGALAFTAYRWYTNSQKPVLTLPATCVAKRADVRSTPGTAAGSDIAATSGTSHTSYFATFDLLGGERVELRLNGREYGQLAEGDRGQLTYQGWAFKDFVRQVDGATPHTGTD